MQYIFPQTHSAMTPLKPKGSLILKRVIRLRGLIVQIKELMITLQYLPGRLYH